MSSRRPLLSVLLMLLWLLLPSCKKEGGSYAMEAVGSPGMVMADEAAEPTAGGEGASTWKRSSLAANTTRITVGDNETLALRHAEVRTQVVGFRARVMLDLLFENPYHAGLEANFALRLPDGASPYYLAFGRTVAAAEGPVLRIAADPEALEPSRATSSRSALWDEPREAVMAEREQAAVAYGNTVRRGVDPALAEWAGAGMFNARLFPLEQGINRVVIGYDMDLTRIGDDLELLLPLPTAIESSTVELDVVAPDGVAIELDPAGQPERAAGHARFFLDQLATDRVTLRLRDVPPIMLTGRDLAVGEFFGTRVIPQLPAQPSDADGQPRAALFMLDASLSSNPERFEIWRALTREILERNRDQIDRFAVMVFSIDAHWWRPGWVENTPNNLEQLLQFTDELALEGATDLGAALREAASPSWQQSPIPHDTFLLGDGAATWGEDDVLALTRSWREAQGGALFVYDTGIEGGSGASLQQLARETGGARFSVVGESELAAAAVAHRSRPWELESLRIAGGSDLMIEGRPRALYSGQRLTIVGRGRPAPGAKLELELRQDGRTHTLELEIPAVVESSLAPRLYAEVAVAQLEELVELTRPEAVAFARHFRIVGRTCSLVMLDSDQDYAEAGIGEHDDARVVRARLGSEAVAEALAQLGARLGDAKLSLLTQIDRLRLMPGVLAELPEDVLAFVHERPSSAFAIEAERLSCPLRSEAALDGELREQLRRREPDYDSVVADAQRRAESNQACALIGLSSMVEASPGDAVLARDVAFTAASWGLPGQAAQLLQRVARARPYEPLTYHALARTLADTDELDLAIVYFELALAGQWDRRFGEIRRIVLLDYARMLARAERGPWASFATYRRAQLRDELGLDEADLVVTIMWNTDNTDVDLHVYEPRRGHCYYSNPQTRNGGQLTLDVTQGYGPEMYVIRNAPRGEYEIQAHYYASDRNRMSARTKVYATIIEGFGTEHERVSEKVVTLALGKDTHDIAKLRLEGSRRR